ncbi:hypothetical protein BS78_02G218000 [Paspalum vaginatum]|nr:hypothetical protein BS78_02G218000 [Paspalum vaginatum]
MARATPEDVLAAASAGRNWEGVPVPGGVAATAANGRWQGDRAEGVTVVELMTEEEKEGVDVPRAEGVPVIDMTAEEEEEEGQGVGDPRAEGVMVIDMTLESSDDEAEEEVKWVGQYSSSQSILLVGDGDFSFSLALATGFGSGTNLVATSIDCYDTLKKKYSGAESNLAELKKMGAVTLHGVNAKTMKLHTDLKMRRFDRIVFNFPHAGFKGKEDQPHMINSHRNLVKDFFHSASFMLRPDGEVHVSHKTTYPYRKWNLEELASVFALFLIEQVDFHIQDYPGYNNKRGDGQRCDQPFLLGKCSTFKFKIGDIKNKRRARKTGPMPYSGRSRNAHFNYQPADLGPFHPIPLVPQMPQPYVPFHMPSMPAYSEFITHEAVQRCRLAEAGCIPEPISYTAVTVPRGHPWHGHPWTWGSSW